MAWEPVEYDVCVTHPEQRQLWVGILQVGPAEPTLVGSHPRAGSIALKNPNSGVSRTARVGGSRDRQTAEELDMMKLWTQNWNGCCSKRVNVLALKWQGPCRTLKPNVDLKPNGRAFGMWSKNYKRSAGTELKVLWNLDSILRGPKWKNLRILDRMWRFEGKELMGMWNADFEGWRDRMEGDVEWGFKT